MIAFLESTDFIREPMDPCVEAWFEGATGQPNKYEYYTEEYKQWSDGRLEWEFLRGV